MQLPDRSISSTLIQAISTGEFDPECDETALFFDLDWLDERLSSLKSAFPSGTNHAIAIKANPLLGVLKRIVSRGFGLEAATLPELHLAVSAGCEPKKIVFDSPAKTSRDIEYALDLGCHINCDSIEELDRVDRIIRANGNNGGATFGLRLNPQVGAGSIASTSVADQYSKFAVPVGIGTERIVQLFTNYEWLTGIHCHIGSQGCSLEMLVEGAQVISKLVFDIEESTNRKLIHIDIGGGLPAQYKSSNSTASFSDYANALEVNVANLLTNGRRLITEFGRHVHTNAGWMVSRVEYVKSATSPKTAIIHVGADMFLRECYRPDDWYHDIIALDSYGSEKDHSSGDVYNIAGPLCFAGDIVGYDRKLPRLVEGDLLVIKDAGAYTFSMWSRYNSRQFPKIFGYYKTDTGTVFEQLRKKESIPEVIDFWS
ncbi:diaminopimelate decarboxylase [Pontivivens ytuae]|uniref:Diaminopimelate decarboxylase n=1 Tax=Pontivivens ytuae TaxID=2789856 RepID=A0A7S9LVR9_9RHOB|nr:diaminopimelate decarboxylase [Pontivivens ytuae]QPH56014.1 diaminopimelate decarboxylase [Pontivivens ytuae]